ncbi:hypothetical protein AVEN_223388-1 [Araneus ventricosus]|uniref:Uncharacterized protein n=1 Tax=Araneus ventricosus TaxID=182803 RepID=A0A4Y2NPV4_ARAVE|nr:hypothetical protein AVEN_223388-1 [Araneus ventricosus]
MGYRNGGGTKGRGTPVEFSHYQSKMKYFVRNYAGRTNLPQNCSSELSPQCEVLKDTRKLSHGKSDRASQVASRERLVKGADKPFPDCVIPEGLLLKFTAILTSSGHTRSK